MQSPYNPVLTVEQFIMDYRQLNKQYAYFCVKIKDKPHIKTTYLIKVIN